jgi:hypothetical protein
MWSVLMTTIMGLGLHRNKNFYSPTIAQLDLSRSFVRAEANNASIILINSLIRSISLKTGSTVSSNWTVLNSGSAIFVSLSGK